jgi:HEAT repeat protein
VGSFSHSEWDSAKTGQLQEYAPHLFALLKDSDRSVQQAAAAALGGIGEEAETYVPHLLELLRNGDASARWGAIEALGWIKKGANESAPHLVELLKSSDTSVQNAAAEALGRIGEGASAYAPQLVVLLKDRDAGVRRAAAFAMGGMGANASVPLLIELLKDGNGGVRWAAAHSLGQLGDRAEEAVPHLAELLSDRDIGIPYAAAEALRRLGEGPKEAVPHLVDTLMECDGGVHWAAAILLRGMGEKAKAYVPHLVELLRNRDASARRAAAATLEGMGERAEASAPHLIELLRDEDRNVREAAVRALGAMGPGAKESAPHLVELLKDDDVSVRWAAAAALGRIGEGAKKSVPRLVELLKDSHLGTQQAAAASLGRIGEGAKESAPHLIALLKDRNENTREVAAQALVNFAPLDASSSALIVNAALINRIRYTEWLVLAHVTAGGDPLVERVLRWAVRSDDERPNSTSLKEARETLEDFREFWPHAKGYPRLQAALADSVAAVSEMQEGSLTSVEDISLLESLSEILEKDSYRRQAGTLDQVIASARPWRWLRNARWLIASHLVFWLLLVFVYPYSPSVQAIFFWNSWVRRMTGLFYVDVLLTWVPFLRRRLLSPFARILTADAGIGEFQGESYFDRSEVIVRSTQKRMRIVSALPYLRGQTVLEGASGLGKSSFLRYLLSRSKRLAVYLPAERCSAGVLEAIQAKLEGHAKDAAFLRSLIYSGALDIYIDGLNEVTADARARIVQFMESHFHGNILVATQRIEWTPPATAQVLFLQPLSDADIAEFLRVRGSFLESTAKLRGEAYAEQCGRFMAESLAEDRSEQLRRAIREVLSNPMDLTVVAQMLGDGMVPDLSNLRQQQYEAMAKEYAASHLTEFPLGRFAEEAYQMRKSGQAMIDEAAFDRELLAMERFRMVLKRQWRGSDKADHREWRFRHDKIQEFFIAYTFLPLESQRELQHLGDPRFRGVYVLLVSLLQLDRARTLRDRLVEYAADTGDHSVSDDYVKLWKNRETMQPSSNPSQGATLHVFPPQQS